MFLLVSINNISLDQLWKLPTLIQHFKEHNQRDSKVSMAEFLSMHYWGKDINDNDQAQDQQLPFKDFSNYVLRPFFFSSAKTFTIRTDFDFFKKDFPLTKDTFFPDTYLSSLYRPPQA